MRPWTLATLVMCGGSTAVAAGLVPATGCSGSTEQAEPARPDATLELLGPDEVTVRTFGPVQAPGARLSDGTALELGQLSVQVDHPEIAKVEGGVVHATAPGKAHITYGFAHQAVVWTLHVQPEVRIVFPEPPASIAVGQTVPLQVDAMIAGEGLDRTALTWMSSNPAVATVDGSGLVTAVSTGRVWITAEAGRAQAMAEIAVVAEGAGVSPNDTSP